MSSKQSQPGHLSRREAIGGVAALALAAGRARGAELPVQRGAIDIHHHFFPPFFKARVEAEMRAAGALTPEAVAWTPERSIAVMDRAGVETAVVSIAASSFNVLDGAELARRCNEYAAQMIADHAGRFRFFAALPMPNVEASIDEANYALDHLGASGIGLLTNYDTRLLSDPAFMPLFELLDRRKAVVYVHPTNAPCCVGLVPGVPDAFLEFPFNTARTITGLLWSGTLSRFPNMRLVLSHGGGALPMVIERIKMAAFAIKDAATLVPEGVDAVLARLHVDTATIVSPVAFAALRAWLPPSHILFGTDYPWGRPDRDLQHLAELHLPSVELAGIRRDNALALLATMR